MMVKERYLEIVYFHTAMFLAILPGYDKGLIQIEWMVKKGKRRCKIFTIEGKKEEAVKADPKIQN